MRSLGAWLLRLVAVFERERRDQELAEEMEAHLLLHIEEKMRGGMSLEEAGISKSTPVGQAQLTCHLRQVQTSVLTIIFPSGKPLEQAGVFYSSSVGRTV